MSAAARIGEKLALEMKSQGLTAEGLAEQTGKDAEHVRAVLDGYPNSASGSTMLDTVDDIATKLGMTLDVVADPGP